MSIHGIIHWFIYKCMDLSKGGVPAGTSLQLFSETKWLESIMAEISLKLHEHHLMTMEKSLGLISIFGN